MIFASKNGRGYYAVVSYVLWRLFAFLQFTTLCEPQRTAVTRLFSVFAYINLSSIMAALIARITRENRERILKRRHYVNSSKSVYALKAFPERFDPQIHNKESILKYDNN